VASVNRELFCAVQPDLPVRAIGVGDVDHRGLVGSVASVLGAVSDQEPQPAGVVVAMDLDARVARRPESRDFPSVALRCCADET
jgi:hypothetical protein